MTPFDINTAPLDHGITLIEASAGTGKTFSLASLYLRLVLEVRVPVQKILAVTYTVAATQELKERIRTRLRDCLAELRAIYAGGHTSVSTAEHPEPKEPVLAHFLAGESDLAPAIQRLNLAVQSLDEAQIFTIHGFCQRALRDHAFESGSRYDSELISDEAALTREVCADFWRKTYYPSSPAAPLLAALALDNGESVSAWAQTLRRKRSHSQVLIFPERPAGGLAELERALLTAFTALSRSWQAAQTEVQTLLETHPALSRSKDAFRPDRVAEIISHLDSFSPEKVTAQTLSALGSLRASFIAKSLLKKRTTDPHHPFFAECEEFFAHAENYSAQLAHTFLEEATREMEHRQRERNILTFSDLITQLHAALNGPNGRFLASALNAKYEAALIDEFQDTDPLQYEIFTRLFAQQCRLFYIGDPKQAIYGFRGADVFTYLRAASTADRQTTLTQNWRSHPLLIEGFNALFSQTPSPFVFKEITYPPVAAPQRPADTSEGTPVPTPPLVFQYLRRGERKPANQNVANQWLWRQVVADIARLRSAEGVSPREMAVLVRSKRQAREIQDALTASGIPSVLQTEEGVLQSAEAREFQLVLDAILEPRGLGRIKAALATAFMGYDAAKIAQLDLDETAALLLTEQFRQWQATWREECFMAMFRRWMVERCVRERLIALPSGERRLTNLLHIAELLHQEESTSRLAPPTLCDWLRSERLSEEKTTENAQLRLESDEEAVIIATIHKSKGLEYGHVFCPYLWLPADPPRKTDVQFHDEASSRLAIDLRGRRGAPAAHVERHGTEALAEEARLLYVAVTRAKRQCFIYAGDFKEAEHSALAHLFGERSLLEGMNTLASALPHAISLHVAEEETPHETASEALGFPHPEEAEGSIAASLARARTFTGNLAPGTAFITSFTGLTAGTAVEEPEHDQPTPTPQSLAELDLFFNATVAATTELPTTAAKAPAPIFLFERGTRAGEFFHAVLEDVDFQDPESLPALVQEKLARYGFAGSPYAEALSRKLAEVLALELKPGLRLCEVPMAKRLSEVEFLCRMKRLSPQRLRELFAPYANETLDGEGLNRLRFSPVRGFLTGVIDLLFEHDGKFYVLDWKSNWLGDTPEDYDAPGIAAAMRHHHYALQAHLYTLAADRYLAARLPGYDYEEHFGGFIYVFIRGIEPANPARGLCHHRPPVELVRELAALTLPESLAETSDTP